MKKVKQPSYRQRKAEDVPNKKLIIGVGSVLIGFIVLMAVLLIVNN